MISNTHCFQIASFIDKLCPQDRVIEVVGETGAENGATVTQEVDGMSGGDVVEEIQQDGDTSGGHPLTVEVSN